MTSSAADPFIGQVLEDRYQVDELIARGGMANVYKATDLRLGRTVALKILAGTLANDPNFVERFIHEARATASLMHPNVVAVHDQGIALGFPFLVMEYVPGKTIREVMAQSGPFTSAHALEIMKSVLAGLTAAHDAGFVHRDIKPENVLITNEGLIKVTDFGLARVMSDQPASTSTGAVLLGTMAYLSPEQVQQQTIDARSDVYSSGILLYEMVTGKVPFTGTNPLDVAFKHVNEDVPAPSIIQPDVPPAVDHLVLAATARNINDRLASARAFQDGVIRALNAVPQAEALTTALPLQATQVLPTITPQMQAPAGMQAVNETASSEGEKVGRRASRQAVKSEMSGGKPGFFAAKKNTLIKVAVGIAAVVIGAGVWYMFSGTFQPVPAVAGQSIDQAAPKFAELGLTYEPIQEFSDSISAGTIIRTDPGEGKRARVGNPVKVYISKGPERYIIPADIVGKTPAEVEQILNDLNLKVTGTEEIYDDLVEAGKVASTNPAPGASLKRDTEVVIQISKGPEPVAVPKLVGLQLAEATPTMTTLGLSLQVKETVESETVPAGAIISTDPVEGTTVTKGTVVKVSVSSGPAPIVVPNVVGLSTADATAKLQAAGFVVATDNSIVVVKNQVLTQSVPGGSKAAKGTTVTIKIW